MSAGAPRTGSSDGVRCALSNGTTLGAANLWTGQLSNANTWDQPQYYGTINYADINGDGSDDLCARALDGVKSILSALRNHRQLPEKNQEIPKRCSDLGARP